MTKNMKLSLIRKQQKSPAITPTVWLKIHA